MTTLYIRDVPEDVTATLKARAASEGTSLSSYVASQLAKLAARPTNDEVVARLRAGDRSGGPTVDEIVSALDDSRR